MGSSSIGRVRARQVLRLLCATGFVINVFLMSYSQEGDVIELCQVSDIRAGGIPIVSIYLTELNRNRTQ